MSATESSLVTPFGVDSWVELYDSDIKAIAAGPLHYAQMRGGQLLDIDRFVRDLQEQFFQIGFGVQVQVWTTEIEGTYLALDRPHTISFSWRPLRAAFDSVVTVTLEPHGEGQTRMTIAHSRLPQEWLGSYETGWGSIADALERRVRR